MDTDQVFKNLKNHSTVGPFQILGQNLNTGYVLWLI